MSFLRVRLPLLAALWIAGHAAALAVAPVSLTLAGPALAAECECSGGMTAQACPMHRSPNRGAGPEGDRAIRSACSPDDSVLLAMGMGLGVLPAPVALRFTLVDGDVGSSVLVSISRAASPDPFPPRT